MIDERGQTIRQAEDALGQIKAVLAAAGVCRPMLVCGRSAQALPGWEALMKDGPVWTVFSEFTPNPDYASAAAGAERFRASDCDGLVSIGGGSAMDVAKTVKLFLAATGDPLEAKRVTSSLFHLAVPTTAGTGSESTQFAVIYKNGEKKSAEAPCLRPDVVLLDGGLLKSLPPYQRKCTWFDALGQCVESLWARGATAESRAYAREGLERLLAGFGPWMEGEEALAGEMLLGANLSGRAINLSKTTAAHAMSYGISAAFHIPHGHAVGIALPAVWEALLARSRENEALSASLTEIAACFGAENTESALARYRQLLCRAGLETPAAGREVELVKTVNLQRLGNTPADFTAQELEALYRRVFAPA